MWQKSVKSGFNLCIKNSNDCLLYKVVCDVSSQVQCQQLYRIFIGKIFSMCLVHDVLKVNVCMCLLFYSVYQTSFAGVQECHAAFFQSVDVQLRSPFSSLLVFQKHLDFKHDKVSFTFKTSPGCQNQKLYKSESVLTRTML